MWGMSMKNKKIWDWIMLIQKNNEFVNMWLVKYYQNFMYKQIWFIIQKTQIWISR